MPSVVHLTRGEPSHGRRSARRETQKAGTKRTYTSTQVSHQENVKSWENMNIHQGRARTQDDKESISAPRVTVHEGLYPRLLGQSHLPPSRTEHQDLCGSPVLLANPPALRQHAPHLKAQ